MNLIELARRRRSVRQYAPDAVEPEKIDYMLEAARLAPSAVNYQPWYFLLVQAETGRAALQACYPREWFRTAPCYLVVCGDHTQSWKRSDGKDHLDIDAAIAAEHICLAATEMGLGTCWVCNFDAARLKEAFHLPPYVEPVVILPFGYAAEAAQDMKEEKKRKPMEDILKRETF